MRLFLAIELDEGIRQHLVRMQKMLAPADPRQRISLTRAENLHITVRFLGEVPDGDVPGVCDALDDAARMAPLELAVAGVACFPPRGPVRIVAADVAGPVELLEAYYRIEEALVPLGFPREGRAYHPHVTLARARTPLPAGYRKEISDRPAAAVGPRMTIEALTLMSSDLRKEGPVYTPVRRFI